MQSLTKFSGDGILPHCARATRLRISSRSQPTTGTSRTCRRQRNGLRRTSTTSSPCTGLSITSQKRTSTWVSLVLAPYRVAVLIAVLIVFDAIVIGTLDAQDYALFVSHEHPDGQVDFNVFSAARTGQPWGEFSFSFDLSSSFLGGPSYDEPIGNPQWSRNISSYGNNGKWESVLLARLRFKPDQTEPTSL